MRAAAKRKYRSMQHEDGTYRELALLFLFVSACRKVTAVCLRLQAFGQKRSRSEASCCSHEKPGLETGKPKLAATRYCPEKKASRGTAKAVWPASQKMGRVCRKLGASTKAWHAAEKVKRKMQRSRKRADRLRICPHCGSVRAK